MLANPRLADGSAIPIVELHRLALEANLLPSIFDTKAQDMWLGRKQRTASEHPETGKYHLKPPNPADTTKQNPAGNTSTTGNRATQTQQGSAIRTDSDRTEQPKTAQTGPSKASLGQRGGAQSNRLAEAETPTGTTDTAQHYATDFPRRDRGDQ